MSSWRSLRALSVLSISVDASLQLAAIVGCGNRITIIIIKKAFNIEFTLHIKPGRLEDVALRRLTHVGAFAIDLPKTTNTVLRPYDRRILLPSPLGVGLSLAPPLWPAEPPSFALRQRLSMQAESTQRLPRQLVHLDS